MLAHTLLARHLFQATAAVARSEPGYWHQPVGCRFWASLGEDTGVLNKSQRVREINRSPDTLRTLGQ
jgi:hypothetical protein